LGNSEASAAPPQAATSALDSDASKNKLLFHALNSKVTPPPKAPAHKFTPPDPEAGTQYLDRIDGTTAARDVTAAEVYRVGQAMHSDVMVVTVASSWLSRTKATRLRHAKELWRRWAQLNSPDDPNRSYLWIDDPSGKRVGGSRVMSGSLVWVK
jgi:hypothetical protein